MTINDKLPNPIKRLLPSEKARAQAREAAATPDVPHTDLRNRRDSLADKFTKGQYHLAGLVFEMAIRVHYRLGE